MVSPAASPEAVDKLLADEGSVEGRLGGYLDFSSVDWPEHPSFVVFFAGCNFRCPWCQNGDLVPVDSGQATKLAQVFRRVARSLPVVEAIVSTGAEPTLQPEALNALCEGARKLGLKTFLDTNGSKPEVVAGLAEAGLIDYVSVDFKARPQAQSYARATGLSEDAASHNLRRIRKTLDVCRARGIPFEARTTIVPGIFGDVSDIIEITKELGGCRTYWVQQFEPSTKVLTAEYREMGPTDPVLVRQMAQAAADAASALKVISKTRQMGVVPEKHARS